MCVSVHVCKGKLTSAARWKFVLPAVTVVAARYCSSDILVQVHVIYDQDFFICLSDRRETNKVNIYTASWNMPNSIAFYYLA